jgi:hypothetical protein
LTEIHLNTKDSIILGYDPEREVTTILRDVMNRTKMQHHMPEDLNLQRDHCESLISHKPEECYGRIGQRSENGVIFSANSVLALTEVLRKDQCK